MVSCGYKLSYGMIRNPTEKGAADSGRASKHELSTVRRALTDLAEAPIVINDEANLTIERIQSIAQKWKDTEGLDILIVDYIQLVRTTKQGEARHEELSMIAGSLKQLAKQLKIPVVTASQLNAEGRMAKAKSIGDDADVVMRIEEDGIYVLKNRNGEKHVTLNLKLDGKMQRFEEFYGDNYNR
jgi:replicative DNA helicase